MYTNLIFSGIDFKDSPDFSDAQVENGLIDGETMTAAQLDELNDDQSKVYELLLETLY
jgi:hypothetical protein